MSFTLKDVQEAVAILRANNVPPGKCTECGAGVYMLTHDGFKTPDRPVMCNDCDEKRRGKS